MFTMSKFMDQICDDGLLPLMDKLSTSRDNHDNAAPHHTDNSDQDQSGVR